MTVIGLTGGIASGKSTVADQLRQLGASVIDGDRMGHRSYEPGTTGFEKVVNAFGHDIVGKDGLIDRRVLGGKVFGAPGEMERLNTILWPEIKRLIQAEIRDLKRRDRTATIVLEAAVLIEAGWQDLCDEVWVVTTPVKMAVDRLAGRNGLSEDAAMARINAQMSSKDRAEHGDVKIENAGSEEQLRAKVERAWKALQRRVPEKERTQPRPQTKPAPVRSAARRAPSKPSKPALASANGRTAAPARPAASRTAAGRPQPAPSRQSTSAAALSRRKPASGAAAASSARTSAARSTTARPASATRPAASATRSATATRPAAAARSATATRPAAAARTTAARPAARTVAARPAPARPAVRASASRPAARPNATRTATKATSARTSSARASSVRATTRPAASQPARATPAAARPARPATRRR